MHVCQTKYTAWLKFQQIICMCVCACVRACILVKLFNAFQWNCLNLVYTCNIALILFLKCNVTKLRIPPPLSHNVTLRRPPPPLTCDVI